MGLLAILPCLVAALLILGHTTTGSDNFLVKSTDRVQVRSGHTVTLPCWLSPRQSAQALEVQWHHNLILESSLLHYKDKKISILPSYAGRVSFGYHGEASGGLTTGDVSLKLVDVTLQDSGEYTCYVSSDQNHDSASVTLAVTETGGPLRLSAEWTDSNMVNVSCGSEGWFPQPYLRWSDQRGAVTPQSVQYGGQPPGTLSVHSWVLVPSSSEIICTVGLQGGEEKESRLLLSKAPQDSASATAAVAALAVLFALAAITAITAIGLGIVLHRKREKKSKSKMEINDMKEEGQSLLTQDMDITDMSTVKKNYENIRIFFPENKHPYLTLKDNQNDYTLRDQKGFPKGTKVSCLTAITGTDSFSSGEHYWEVSVAHDQVGLKESWWLGVTKVFNIPADADFSPTASQGYWFLSSSPENPDFLQLNTEPAALFRVWSKPRKVGVYLNCDRGELTFYNVQNSSIIGSLKADFQGGVFPLFNPGLFDAAPLKILHQNITEPCVSNTEESVAPDPEKQ